jgi:hypothetical protein
VFLSLPIHWHGLFEFFQQLFLIGNGSSFTEYQNVLSKTKVKEQLKYLKLIIPCKNVMAKWMQSKTVIGVRDVNSMYAIKRRNPLLVVIRERNCSNS